MPAQVTHFLFDEPVGCTLNRSRLDRYNRPETDVHESLFGRNGVERPHRVGGAIRIGRQAQWAEPDRFDRDVFQEPAEEIGGPVDGYLDVLDHPFQWRPAMQSFDPVRDAEPTIEGDEFPVEGTAPQALWPESSNKGLLRAER